LGALQNSVKTLSWRRKKWSHFRNYPIYQTWNKKLYKKIGVLIK